MATLGDIVTTLSVDKRGFEGGLAAAGKDAKKYSGGLAKELKVAEKEVQRLSEAFVSGGKVTRDQLQEAVKHVDRLKARIDAAKTAVASLGGAMGDLPEIGRGEWQGPRQLNLHQLAMEEQAARSGMGPVGGGNRTMMFGSRAGRGFSGGGGGGRMALMAGAYGLSDAATAAQFGGGRAAALSLANNLPMVGEGIGDMAARMSKAAGPMGRMTGFLARWAGPAGLVASVALPLTTLLAPGLLDFESAASKAEKAAGRVDARVSKGGSAKQEQADLFKVVSESNALIASAGRNKRGFAERAADAFGGQFGLSSAREADEQRGLEAAQDLAEATRRLAEIRSRVAAEESATATTAAKAKLARIEERRMEGFRDANFAGARRFRADEMRRRISEENERLDPSFGDRDRLRATDEFQMAQSLLGSLQGRQMMLEQQRTFLQNDRPMQLPGAHVAGQSASKILDLVQNRKNIEAERIQKQLLKVNEKQLAEVKRLTDTIKEKFPDLKPSRA